MQFVSTRAGRVAVEAAGEGPPLVLLHSGTHDRHDYDPILPALAGRFRVLAVDWPGHGDSEMPAPPSSMSVGLLCDVLEDVVGALGLGPAVFVGNSVGGTASLRLAARRPGVVRGLVLVDSGGLVEQSALVRAFCWVQGRHVVRRRLGLPFARAYLKKQTSDVEASLTRMERALTRPAFVEMAAALWRSFGTAQNDLAEEARRIRCPTLIVWGKHDIVIRARVEGRRIREVLPHAGYVELDTGHVPFLEDPQAFLAATLPFLHALPATREDVGTPRAGDRPQEDVAASAHAPR
jgi:pimeloyl-ACP methyl ester carboxylesterase